MSDPFDPARLGILPHRAVVAFAARCARRAEALWPAPEETPPPSFEAARATTTRALEVAEAYAAGGKRRKATAEPVPDAASDDALSAAIAGAAAQAAEAARVPFAGAADSAAQSADLARAAALLAGGEEAGRAVGDAAVWDLKLLNLVSTLEGWTHLTAVRPDFFGPLWPDGEPAARPLGAEGALAANGSPPADVA
jgi:hypothetical protein